MALLPLIRIIWAKKLTPAITKCRADFLSLHYYCTTSLRLCVSIRPKGALDVARASAHSARWQSSIRRPQVRGRATCSIQGNEKTDATCISPPCYAFTYHILAELNDAGVVRAIRSKHLLEVRVVSRVLDGVCGHEYHPG